jgi:hypothetical protein
MFIAEQDPDTDWQAKARELAGVPWTMLTRAGADGLIHRLEQHRAAQVVDHEDDWGAAA